MQFIVPADRVSKLIRPQGISVTLINSLAVDVYFDTDPARLLATPTGTVPNGTKIAATTGSIVIAAFSVPYYFRAVSSTFLEVQP
jgi:hypothetical protein